jgi:hypothetical protein
MRRSAALVVAIILSLSFAGVVRAQSTSASLTGVVTDPQKAIVVDAKVAVINVGTNESYSGATNGRGEYFVTNLPPGSYRIEVEKTGFKTVIKPDVTLHLQDTLEINFEMTLGSISESITVEAGAPLLNTSDGSVGTVIDRNFVDNLPLNGRSFNTLLQLTPGVLIVGNSGDGGQFSVNGQRSNANYFEVDGVGVNFGVGAGALEQSGSGATQAFNAYGGTASLVSVDAMQEFRVETSSFAPEYGRAPGGQVGITTRSGTSEFHGDAFDYLRNTVLDANDWFANAAGEPRAAEEQNDFGGVFGGPLVKGKTFFFFSYEGLRLLQPEAQVVQVPSLALRSSAIPSAAAFLSAYPQPDPDAPVSGNGDASPFTGTYSNRITMDAISFRVDHHVNDRLSLFGRIDWSPSQAQSHVYNLSDVQNSNVNTETLTLGANAQISKRFANSTRFNYSRQQASTRFTIESFGGAVPPSGELLIPPPNLLTNSVATFDLFGYSIFSLGNSNKNTDSQWSLVNDLTFQQGAHEIKLGVDFRRLLLTTAGIGSQIGYGVADIDAFASTGATLFIENQVVHPARILFPALSLYAQDRWEVGQRLTLTYGLRWELNPAPSPQSGSTLASWENVNTPAQIALAPAGTSPWRTQYGNVAPRVGLAYKLSSNGDAVLRAGFGVFYDLGTGIASALSAAFPNSASLLLYPSPPVPVSASAIAPSFSTQPPFPASSSIFGFAPNLQLPYSLQWNLALEKSLEGKQSLSVTYVGQAGRRLLRTEAMFQPNPNFTGSTFVLSQNGDTSNYNALQVQYRRPMAQHVQALVNYTWSHSIDTDSDDSFFGVPGTIISVGSNRGSSDFDVRNNLTGALVLESGPVRTKPVLSKVVDGWSLATVFQARTGFPVDIYTESVPIPNLAGGSQTRPDLVPGQPVWLYGAQCASTFQALGDLALGQSCPGGKGLNPNAFVLPPTPGQGTLRRNAIIGFSATQFDASIQRTFKLTEKLNLLFRTDVFNVINHPNFASVAPFGNFDSASFGIATQMLNQGFEGGLNPLYQIGGPRSMQAALKLVF